MTMQINSVDSSFTVCFNFFVGSKAERVQLFSLSLTYVFVLLLRNQKMLLSCLMEIMARYETVAHLVFLTLS